LLFYDRTGLTNQQLDSWCSYNYRTQEVDKGTLGTAIVSATEYAENDQDAIQLVTAGATLVHSFNSTTKDDDGTRINRYWTSGWQQLGGESGWLHGMRLTFAKSRYARVAISLAVDNEEDFDYRQVFRLIGGAPSDQNVEIDYKIPAQFVEWAKVKIEFFHDNTGAETELLRAGFVTTPTKQVGILPGRSRPSENY
jgi:hypothetical protein